MSHLDEHGRPEPPLHATERETLLGFLDYQRATFAWKTRGVDRDGLNLRVAASSLSLGGMLKHLAAVEDYWFSYWLDGADLAEPFAHIDLETETDWEWESARHDSPDYLRSLWEDFAERSRTRVSAALERGDLSQSTARLSPSGESPSLRWVLCHMIEEYARHNGHADLLREAVDGEVGE